MKHDETLKKNELSKLDNKKGKEIRDFNGFISKDGQIQLPIFGNVSNKMSLVNYKRGQINVL